jgi:hypothetical protein
MFSVFILSIWTTNLVAPNLELLLPEVKGWRPDAAIARSAQTIKKAELVMRAYTT